MAGCSFELSGGPGALSGGDAGALADLTIDSDWPASSTPSRDAALDGLASNGDAPGASSDAPTPPPTQDAAAPPPTQKDSATPPAPPAKKDATLDKPSPPPPPPPARDATVDMPPAPPRDATVDSPPPPPPPPTGVSGAWHFPPASVWRKNIENAAIDSQSSQVINWLKNAGGWGGGSMRIDFSIEVMTAPSGTPLRSFIKTGDHFSPDCDSDKLPIVAGGKIEGESGYRCAGDGDCHLIVVDLPSKKLYEMWRANIVGGTFYGGCLAVWDLTKVYGSSGRGEQCTSADAAGFPIAPLLFTADEVKAGAINHAIRFILPNARIRNGVYVHPATHSTGATGGGGNAPPYGALLRLTKSFNPGSLKPGARVVARALQRYGMFLSDAGTIALTAMSDSYTSAKWSGLLGAGDLTSLKVTDFEMVKAGPRISYTGNCKRN